MASRGSENLKPFNMKSILKDLRRLVNDPIQGIDVSIPEDDLSDIRANIEGPEGTPYENGVFKCKLLFGDDFPHQPPTGIFTTKLFHPNVSKSGEICVNALKRDWSPEKGISHVLQVIRCLLIFPNPESALNEEAGKLLLDDYDGYFKRAKLMTSIYAIKPKDKEDVNKNIENDQIHERAVKKAKSKHGKKRAGLKRL